MVSVVFHSKFGVTTAKPMVCVDIKNSIPENEPKEQYELQGSVGDEVQAPAEDSFLNP